MSICLQSLLTGFKTFCYSPVTMDKLDGQQVHGICFANLTNMQILHVEQFRN